MALGPVIKAFSSWCVSVVGSFNDWTPGRHELRPHGDQSTRSVEVNVPRGSTVHFRYLGHGDHWFDDADADSIDQDGSSLLAEPPRRQVAATSDADLAVPSDEPEPAKAGTRARKKSS